MTLNLSKHYSKQLEDFNNSTVERLIRQDIGSAGFPTLEEKLSTMRSMLNESIAIITSLEELPNVYIDKLFTYISAYNSHGSNLLGYDPDVSNSAQLKQSFIRVVEEFYEYMLTGIDSNNQRTNEMPFVSLYSTLKQRQFDNISSAITDVNNNKKEFNDLKEKAEELVGSLQDKAKEVSLNDYSQIFSKQAESHSNWKKSELGSAQIWLIITFILVLVFIVFTYNINSIYPIETNVSGTIITIEYLTRVLIVSFLIYLITFCAKQFNIQQHLAVVNKHRENTLNSYKLFIDSLGDSNSEIKHALMMEVAKAIYDSGQTGYLGSNDKSDSTPSLIEMTKYVSGNK